MKTKINKKLSQTKNILFVLGKKKLLTDNLQRFTSIDYYNNLRFA